MLMSTSSSDAVSNVQHRATLRTVYPPPPRTNVGILKPRTNLTHSLRRSEEKRREEEEEEEEEEDEEEDEEEEEEEEEEKKMCTINREIHVFPVEKEFL